MRRHRLAAVLHANDHTDAVLLAFARDLQGSGVRVAGLVQLSAGLRPAGTPLALLDLASGERHVIAQQDAAAGDACSLDMQALAMASSSVRSALASRPLPDLMLLNRFGTFEAAGQGLRTEIGAVYSAGVPLLLAVRERRLADWQRFCGGLADTLPAQRSALEQWWRELNAPHSVA